MLEKRFSPSWLAGTSVGDLMFQADYYLKELSMGEFLDGTQWSHVHTLRCCAACGLMQKWLSVCDAS